MKKVRRNIIKASVVLMILFLVITAAFLINLLSLSDKLINSPYNKRLNELRETTYIGSIYDANNILLAGSTEGQREYSTDDTIRNASAHLIGDTYGYCPTGSDIRFASILLNYNESLFSTISRSIKDTPKTGDDIQLTVDYRLNTFVYEQIKNYTGAVIMQDYTTGEILCMVSTPAFDPATLLEDLDESIQNEAFVNRAIQGQYAPGSLFHIVTAGAALESIKDVESKKFNCSGTYKVDDEVIHCSNVHGQVSLDEAFTQSCDTSFAQIGVELGAQSIKSYAERLKFNYNFNYSDVALYPSNISVSPKEDDAAFAYTAIGRHETTTSPLHMSMIAGAIANDGMMLNPSLLKAVEGNLVHKNTYGTRVMTTETAQTLAKYMEHNVLYGSGSEALSNAVNIFGKDGISISSTDDSLSPNSWFLGYIDSPEHPITICIILEQSFNGNNPAVLIAKNILEYAYSLEY